jgi:hypothetical protein
MPRSSNSVHNPYIPTYEQDGKLPVRCWCEATILYVDKKLVSKGFTKSCGRLHCTRPCRQPLPSKPPFDPWAKIG